MVQACSPLPIGVCRVVPIPDRAAVRSGCGSIGGRLGPPGAAGDGIREGVGGRSGSRAVMGGGVSSGERVELAHECERAFGRANELAPNDAEPLLALGDLQRDLGFVAEAVTTLGAEAEEGFVTYHVMNPHDDGISMDEFVDWIAEAGYPVQRVADYADWVGRFETALKALPEK